MPAAGPIREQPYSAKAAENTAEKERRAASSVARRRRPVRLPHLKEVHQYD
ncbi:MAG: hypothetical protein JWN15_219 [Firmicutes bacterium]|nr:hypothetical protein [Bacillota bacterium]